MRNIIFASILLSLVPSCFAGEMFKVVTRKKNGHSTYSWVEFPDLLDPRFAETKDFKIVDQKDSAPLEWSKLSMDDHLRAANALYHLTIAKKALLDLFHSEEVAQLEQVVVRLNFKNAFDEIGHWKNDAKNPSFNTAHSVPKSNPANQVGIPNAPNWNREIWFRPTREIPMKDLLAQLPEDPMASVTHEIRRTFYPNLVQQGLASVLQGIMMSSSDVGSTLLETSIRQGGTLITLEGGFQLMKFMNRALLPKSYYLDTVMVPEIIYHEFSHLALSDYLNPTHATPVVEGMADYFASVISGSPQLAKKIKKYSKGSGKSGKKLKTFVLAYDTNAKATADFVLSMLWGIRKILGNAATDQLVWESRKNLSTFYSTIRDGDQPLIGALLNACATHPQICPNGEFDRMKLLQYFSGEIGL